MTHNPDQQPEIRVTTVDDLIAARHMQARSWRATYPSVEHDVTPEWLEQETQRWLTPEGLEKTVEKLGELVGHEDHFHRVAHANDDIVGLIHGSRVDGIQRLEGLYLDPNYQGAGLGRRMADALFAWYDLEKDITLEVARYNARARDFYERYGFEAVPGSEGMFKERIPDIRMVRKGDKK